MGHPAGVEWFCRRHYGAAKALQNQSLGEALGAIRGQGRLRALLRLGLVLLALAGAATAWNVTGPVALEAAGEGYSGRFSAGRLAGQDTDERGAALAARWVATRTRPTRHPLRILWHQLRYNAWTEGYDLALWLEPDSPDLASPAFALYQSGRTIFLRIEYRGRNRVLDASFSADELEAALNPYLTRPRIDHLAEPN